MKQAQTLLSLHQTKNPFTRFPDYSYDTIYRGNYCKKCHSFFVTVEKDSFVCETCGEHEKIEHAILRNVKEYQLLFPDRKLSTQNIYEWCKADLNKKTICRVLKKNYTAFGHTSDTYYK